MKKSLLIIIFTCLGIFFLQSFTLSKTSIPEGKQPQWKNLHVLPQNISKDGLDSVMHTFTRSLGVKCGYCHAPDSSGRRLNFPSDAKVEKRVAREMMLMSIDINKNHLEEVAKQLNYVSPVKDTSNASYILKYATCYTCHHGKTHPDNELPKMEPGEGQPQGPQQGGHQGN